MRELYGYLGFAIRALNKAETKQKEKGNNNE